MQLFPAEDPSLSGPIHLATGTVPNIELSSVSIWVGDAPRAVLLPPPVRPTRRAREQLAIYWGLNVMPKGDPGALRRLTVEIDISSPATGQVWVIYNFPAQEYVDAARQRLEWNGEAEAGAQFGVGSAMIKIKLAPVSMPSIAARILTTSPFAAQSLWIFNADPAHPFEGGMPLIQVVDVPMGTERVDALVYMEGLAVSSDWWIPYFLRRKEDGQSAERFEIPVDRSIEFQDER